MFLLLLRDDSTDESSGQVETTTTSEAPDTTSAPTTSQTAVPTTAPATLPPVVSTTTTTIPADEDCTIAQTLDQWVCLESISLEAGPAGDVYVIEYSGEFGGETLSFSSGIHLHVFGNHVEPENAGAQALGLPSAWRVVEDPFEIRVETDAQDIFDGTDTKVCAVVADARASRVGGAHFYYDAEGGNCLTLPAALADELRRCYLR